MTRLTYDDASHTEGCTGGKRACVDQRASERPRLVVRRASLQPAQAADLCAVMVCLADTWPTSQSAGAKRWGHRARATCSTTPATTASTSSPMPASTSAAGASPPPSEPAVLTHTRDAGGARLAMSEPAQPPRKHFCLVLPGAADAALHVCLTLEDSRSTWGWVSWGAAGPSKAPAFVFAVFVVICTVCIAPWRLFQCGCRCPWAPAFVFVAVCTVYTVCTHCTLAPGLHLAGGPCLRRVSAAAIAIHE